MNTKIIFFFASPKLNIYLNKTKEMDGQSERGQKYDGSGEICEDFFLSQLHIVSRINSYQR